MIINIILEYYIMWEINAIFTTHDWTWFICTTYKNGDDWGMVYEVVPT